MDRRVQRFNLGMPWEESHGYSQGLRIGSTIHISGQTPHDSLGTLIGADDAGSQTRTVLDNLDRILVALGAHRGHVVENTIMVLDLKRNFEAVSLVHSEYFSSSRPTSTVFGVDALVFPGQMVEISARVNLDMPT